MYSQNYFDEYFLQKDFLFGGDENPQFSPLVSENEDAVKSFEKKEASKLLQKTNNT